MILPSPAFDALLASTRPSLVVHAAGPASVPDSVADPDLDRRGSVDVTAALLERLAGTAARLVLVSSAAVYGDPDRLPVSEDAPIHPISPYGRHRAACEALVREAGVPAVILRVFSAYGEGLRRQVLWDICRKALTGPVELAGTGRESRDFVHAGDVATAVARVAASAEFDGETYNVAGGVETTIDQLAHLLVSSLGTRSTISFSATPRAGDPTRWLADVTRIRGLGWEPSVSIEDGARAYAQWARTA